MPTGIYNRTKAKPNKGMFRKGHKGWNDGLPRSEKTKRKMSKAWKKKMEEGYIPWSKGKKYSEEHRRKMRKNNARYWLNKHRTEEVKIKISQNNAKVWLGKKLPWMSGKNHPNWRGGKSFEPYGLDFNEQLKEKIRKRDNYICQECGYTEKQLGYKLSSHHVDYNKKNNREDNLISLCRNCHSQTNFNRNDWIKYFQGKIL